MPSAVIVSIPKIEISPGIEVEVNPSAKAMPPHLKLQNVEEVIEEVEPETAAAIVRVGINAMSSLPTIIQE